MKFHAVTLIKLIFLIKNQFELSAQWYPTPEGLSHVKSLYLNTLLKELGTIVHFILCHGYGPGYLTYDLWYFSLCTLAFEIVSY